MSFRSACALIGLCAGVASAQDTPARAAERIVAELQRIGAKPAGEKGTYYQNVPLVRRWIDSASVSLSFKGTEMVFPIDVQPLAGFPTIPFRSDLNVYRHEFLLGGRLGDSSAVEPKWVEGAIVVMQPPLRANGQVDYQLWAYREQLVRYRLATALVFPTLELTPRHVLADINAARYEFDRRIGWDSVPPILLVTQAAARAIPAAPARRDYRDPMPAAVGNASFSVKSERPRMQPRNLIALVEGSDARLKSEIVVVTAPLDNLADDEYGVRAESAVLLALAAGMSSSAERPKRSIAFVWITGGESGELGAQWFAEHPTVRRRDIVLTIALGSADGSTLACIRDIANGGVRRPCGA